MVKRRSFLLGAGAALGGVGTLASSGCSNLASGLTPGGTGSSGTVQHMAWSSNEEERELYVELFELFEKKYPDQHVQFLHAPNSYGTKMRALMAGEILPDTFWTDVGYAPQWYESGQMQPLDDIIKEHPELTEGFVPGLLDYGKGNDGVQYSIPKDYNPLVLYYNPEILDKAGVDYPTSDLTLEQFEEMLGELTTPERFGVAWDNAFFSWMNFIGNMGGECFANGRSNFSDPTVRDALTYMVRLYRQGYAPNPVASEQAGQTSVQMFILGRAAMLMSGRWETPELRRVMKMPWEATEVPIGTRRISTVQSGMLTLAKDSPRLENAVLLLRHMLSHEGMAIVNGGGLSIPPYTRMISDPETFTEPPKREPFLATADYVGYQSQLELARSTRSDEFLGKYAQPELDNIFSFRKSVSEGTADIDEPANAGLFAATEGS